jgi:hypothetical protein
MTTLNNLHKNPIQEECDRWVKSLPQDQLASLISHQYAHKKTFDNGESYQRYGLQENTFATDSQDELILNMFCPSWAAQHGYGVAEIKRLAEILPHAKASLQGKLSLVMTLDDIIHLWVTSSLANYFPGEIINESTSRDLTQKLNRYNGEVCAIILQQLQGLTQAKFFTLLNYTHDFQLTDAWLAQLFAHSLHIDEIIDLLHTSLFTSALTEKFHSLKQARDLAQELYTQGWQLPHILQLLLHFAKQAGDQTHDKQALETLQLISLYRLKANVYDSQNRTLLSIIQQHPPQEWIYEIAKLVIFIRFSATTLSPPTLPPDEDPATLINTVLTLNRSDPELIKLILLHSFHIVYPIHNYADSSIVVLPDKMINIWEAADILVWTQKVRLHDTEIPLLEKLLVLKRAVWLAHGYYPRGVQLLSAAILATTHQGMLAEIATGEGKSIITAMLAVLRTLEGKTVDIVTSSSVLAQRDAQEQAGFYQLFGITVDHNIGRLPYNPCYEKDIVYGDVISFVADILEKPFNTRSIRGERPLDLVIIDEVDNAFIDQGSQVNMLARYVSGFEHLAPLFAIIWQQLMQINSHLAYDRELKIGVWVEGQFKYEQGQIQLLGESYAYVVDDPTALSRKMLKSYMEKLLAPGNALLHIPNHLKGLVFSQQDKWIESAIQAQYYVEGRDYVISRDEYNNAIISIVDYRNTGIVYENRHWFNGLHQFLQIKHGVKTKPETLMTKYMSNMAFFKSYQFGVYGLTGTLGAEDEKAFIKETYQADFIKIPTHKPKQFTEWPPVIKTNSSDWLTALLDSLKAETDKGRAVLLILETINEVEQIEQILLDTGYSADKVRGYSRNDLPSDIQSRKIEVGDILIATNLAGRGTDLKTTAALEQNGGMHVCIGYLPTNLRVQLQAYGRTARQGNQGTGQMIINSEIALPQLKRTYPWYQSENGHDNLLAWRDLAEKERLLKGRYAHNQLASIKDELFTYFLELVDQFKKAFSSKLTIEDLMQIEDLWGMWLKEQEDLIYYPVQAKIQPGDITLFQQKNRDIQTKVLANFQAFVEKLVQNWRAGNLIQNPTYFIRKAYVVLHSNPDQAKHYLNQAKALDPIFSFTASYLHALASLIKSDTAKQEAYDNLVDVKQKITELLPQLEGMLAVVNFHAIDQNESELSKQIINKIAIIHKLDEYIVRAAEVIAKSQPEEKIAVKNITPIKDIMQWDIKYHDELEEFEDMGLIELFEVEPFKEKKNWIGTAVSFVCGIVQIVIGVMLAPVSGGMSTSLIVSGVSDILASVKSVITGMPIDLKQYFSAKGIEYAVMFIMAGIDSAKEALTGAKEAGKKAATKEATKQITKEALIEGVKQELTKRAIITGVAYVAEVALDKGLRNYEQDIEDSVKRDIAQLITHYAQQIELALFYDEIIGTPALQSAIRHHALELLKKYQSKYHSASANIIKGVAENAASRLDPLGGVAFKALDIGYSINRISEVTKEFNSQFGQYLADEAKKWILPDEVLRQKLALSFAKADVDNIMGKMMANNVISNRHVVNCNGLAKDKVPEYHAQFELILDLCFSVEKADKSDKRERIDALKARLTDVIASAIINMIKGEIVAPLSSMAGVWGGNTLYDGLQQAQQEVIARFEQDQQVRYLNGQAVPADTKPAATIDPRIEHLFEFTADNEEQVAHYAEEALHHQGGLLDVEILSKVGKMNLHLSIDDVYEGSAYGGVDHDAPEIHLNYDSATNKWQAYEAENKQVKIADSVYTAIASYTDTAASTLRETVKYYIHTNPSEVAALLKIHQLTSVLEEERVSKQTNTPVSKKIPVSKPLLAKPTPTPKDKSTSHVGEKYNQDLKRNEPLPNRDRNQFDVNIVNEYKEKLQPLAKKIEDYYEGKGPAPTQEEIKGGTSHSLEYYQYLKGTKGIPYADTALDVANNQNSFGEFANEYLRVQAIAEGKSAKQIPQLVTHLRITLAAADASLRSEKENVIDSKGNILYSDIAKYHYSKLEKLGLSKKAWGGTFFEAYLGSGSWMFLGGYDAEADLQEADAIKAMLTNKKFDGVGAWEYATTLGKVASKNPWITTKSITLAALFGLMDMNNIITKLPNGQAIVYGVNKDEVASRFNIPKDKVIDYHSDHAPYNDFASGKKVFMIPYQSKPKQGK